MQIKSHISYVVALSGGIDSVVLLHYMRNYSVRAVHINHNLNINSNQWVSFCQHLCKELDIVLEIINININTYSNIEKIARTKRYNALFDNLQTNEVLLTAHHIDDQAETLLLQLFRGSGTLGLSAMPIVKKKSL